ncbi:class I SAM-dependent methyltransferase [Rhodopila sp.]|uniref:class I SAM-dependent methyltransferase n=1 Tax=Rhodopila sp. TaxID=2480087 RepID=UPI003D0E1BF4
MGTTVNPAVEVTLPPRRGLAASLLHRLFSRLHCGSLTVILPDGRRFAHDTRAAGPEAVLLVHRWRVLRRLLLAGDIGFAEAYMDRDWSSPDLAALIELAARHQASIPGANGGAPLARLIQRLRHLARSNTLSGSRRNIVQHYDLGNDFYASWFDFGMTYSSALFTDADATLEAAQTTKQDRVVSLLDPRPGQDILEVGFGWGGLAERLASSGAAVTGLTLSPAQHAYAQARLSAAGLANRVDLRIQDYRQVEGRFDRIVSIEMLEAVGETWWPVFFAMLRDRLRSGGVIVLQTITIADERFASYRRSSDFIQRYIFPGGMLPSSSALRAQIARAGLAVHSVEMFGASYAQTLKLWQDRFQAAWPDIAATGFSARFKLMWEYYLSYCEAGFRAGAIDVGLWRLGHPS